MDNDEREDNLEGNPADAGTDDLDALRHYGTHTLPPGMRMQWLAKPLPRLTEEHLQATDELEPKALEPPPPDAEGALIGSAAPRRLFTRRLVLGAIGLGLIIGGTVTYVARPISKRGDGGAQAATSATSANSAAHPIGTDGREPGYTPPTPVAKASASPASEVAAPMAASSLPAMPTANGASDRIRKQPLRAIPKNKPSGSTDTDPTESALFGAH